nr:hypothetical protein [Bradyrhizobium sp. dw_411]
MPVSGTLIGVCVTLVGLVKVTEARAGHSHVDEYTALAAIAFLACAITSYFSLRCAAFTRLSYWLEQVADIIFIGGLIGITAIAALFAYEVI